MRRQWIRLLAAVLVLLLLAGCGEKVTGPLAELQGRWVDVNSETTLELKGDVLTVDQYGWQEEYQVTVDDSGSIRYLTDAAGTGMMGGMSELQICDDGSLLGYEMILDGDGRTFRFVREEQLAKEHEIRDLSDDLPKQIDSDQIEDFSLSFFNYGGSYGLDDDWPRGSYDWQLTKQEDGSFRMDFHVSGSSYIVMDQSVAVDAAYAAGLARLLRDRGVIEHNGYYMQNNVSRPGIYLYVDYESGEQLRITAKGEAADTCVFDLAALLDYAGQVVVPQEEYESRNGA